MVWKYLTDNYPRKSPARSQKNTRRNICNHKYGNTTYTQEEAIAKAYKQIRITTAYLDASLWISSCNRMAITNPLENNTGILPRKRAFLPSYYEDKNNVKDNKRHVQLFTLSMNRIIMIDEISTTVLTASAP